MVEKSGLSLRCHAVSHGLPSWVVERDGARTVRIRLGAPRLPDLTRKKTWSVIE